MVHLISVNMSYGRSSVNSASPVDLIDSQSPQTLTCHSRKNIGPANTYKGFVPLGVSVSHSSKQASTTPGPWNPSPVSLATPVCFLQWRVKMMAVKEFVCSLHNQMTCCLGWEITRGSKHCFCCCFFHQLVKSWPKWDPPVTVVLPVLLHIYPCIFVFLWFVS